MGLPQNVPSSRVRNLTDVPVRSESDMVVYWMTANRRLSYNFALQRAVEWANRLGKPLVILESVRLRYRWNCERFHQFILDGMIDNATHAEKTNATYVAHIEDQDDTHRGLMEWMVAHACLIVTDDFPCFFHPTLYERIVKHWPCCVELVDGNGILPMRLTDRIFTVAHSYRRYMQKEVVAQLGLFPQAKPLASLKKNDAVPLSAMLLKRWGLHSARSLAKLDVSKMPIGHVVKPTELRGGETMAQRSLDRFLKQRLAHYEEDRNEPSKDGASWLSPYLHFGHVSSHDIFLRLAKACNWSPERIGKPNGQRENFWNMDPNADAYLDQLLTWREIGFNQCVHNLDYDRYDSLPAWALQTLDDHASDKRPYVYDLEQFEKAETHDPLWNAAQRQLVLEGRIHNYLRMLWGKKILHWTTSPREALSVMIELNNKYALDGRNPNSYSGIFWVLGRYDRAWGPERPIFGKIRYMTSESTRSKYHVDTYLQKYRALDE